MGQRCTVGNFDSCSRNRNGRSTSLAPPASKVLMQIESEKPDPSMMAHILYLAVGAIMVVIIAALIIVSWRAHKKNTPPFTKHPTSRMVLPQRAPSIAA